MNQKRNIQVRVQSQQGVFMISVAAQLAEMHPQTLRMYENRGLVDPQRSPKGTRLYSQEDVERLKRIQQMTAELGLNLAGVERVLELEDRLAKARKRISDLEHQLQQLQHEAQTEIERLQRVARGEVVLYRGTTAIVTRRDS